MPTQRSEWDLSRASGSVAPRHCSDYMNRQLRRRIGSRETQADSMIMLIFGGPGRLKSLDSIDSGDHGIRKDDES